MKQYWKVPLGHAPRILTAAVSVHLPQSQRDRTYHFPASWTMHIYQHRGELRVNDEVYPLKPGVVSLVEPGRVHHYKFVGRAEHAYMFLQFPDPQADVRLIPVTQDLGRRFLTMDRAFREAIAWAPTSPVRAAARVWDLLWQLVEDGPVTSTTRAQVVCVTGLGRESAEMPDGLLSPTGHIGVRKACEWVEVHLQSEISLSALAREAGLSAPHLTRLFSHELGMTPMAYLRRRRALRAGTLLRHSTLPIKAIAAEIGIPDLHQFNKTIRCELGLSPKKYRASQPELPITFHHVGRS
jgi:AraC-like DNA-binding protein